MDIEQFMKVYELLRDDILLYMNEYDNRYGANIRDIHLCIYNKKQQSLEGKYKIIKFQEMIRKDYFPQINSLYDIKEVYSQEVQEVILKLIQMNYITMKTFDKYILTEIGKNFVIYELIKKCVKSIEGTVGEKWKLMIDMLSGMGNELWESKVIDKIMGEFAERVMDEISDLTKYFRTIEKERSE